MTRLSDHSAARLPADVPKPGYDRSAIRSGVVHLGLGAFTRAHQIPLFDDALAGGDPRWGVTGVSLRSAVVRDQLDPQDGLYTLAVREGGAVRRRLVGAIRRVLVAPEDPGAVVAALAASDTHLVTLTVTEKGYHLGPDGMLDHGHPEVAHDLAGLERPRTAVGFIVAGLAARRAAALPPFAVLSCDNLPANGAKLRVAVLAMARAHDPALADWIGGETAFPCSMVDRIVPAATPAFLGETEEALGLEDKGAVATEPFSQWVVERFAGPAPDLRRLGVTLVDDVAPWEAAKLRLLNGAHSAMAYLGGLAGIRFVHEFVAWPAGRSLIERLWSEVATTLETRPELDIPAYRAALMDRFGNAALQHRLDQIAADGSHKVPLRLLAPLAERDGSASPALALAVAAWIRWLKGVDDAGEAHKIDDPRAVALTEAAMRADPLAAMLAMPGLFPAGTAESRSDRAQLATAIDALHRHGVRAALEAEPEETQ